MSTTATPIREDEDLDKDLIAQLEKAHAFMSGIHPVMVKAQSNDVPIDPTISDKDGLVTYINASSNVPPDSLQKDVTEISAVLEGLTGILTAAVIIQSAGDITKKHNPHLWNTTYEKGFLPFFAGYSFKEATYYKKTRGVKVATEFIEFLLDAVVSQGTSALGDLAKFLTTQGQNIQANTQGEGDGYKYAIISMVNEVFESSPGQWVYVPKIKYYFTTFTKKSFAVTTSCGSYEEFEMDFKLQVLTASFKIDTWRTNKKFRKSVNEFIEGYTSAKLKDSKNFLDGIFPSKKKKDVAEPSSETLNDPASIAVGDSYPGHQCFKTLNRDIYCSGYIVKDHVTGAAWIAEALLHFNIPASQILGTPFVKENMPAGAIVWPEDV
jgi:hypothetical protein